VNGILAVDKPAGPTSHDVVARVRRVLGTRRVGHAGTLDPFASGLLLLGIGGATRFLDFLHGPEKVYEAEALLGIETDTLDLAGTITRSAGVDPGITLEQVARALESQVGARLQQPPAYSAKKIAGEAAHRKVRRGESVALPPVPVQIYGVELLPSLLPRVGFRVRCGAGTYIRAMARDLGEALGCGAHLVALRRVAMGGIGVEDALPLEALQGEGGRDLALAALRPPEVTVQHLPSCSLSQEEARRLRMGQAIPAREGLPDDVPLALLLEEGGGLVGIGTQREGGVRPTKILPEGADA
jgi:tRNA pseudouridine55 synthase